MMMGFGGFGLLFVLFFFVILIGLAIWLVSVIFPRPGGSTTHPVSGNLPTYRTNRQGQREQESPLDTLKQRYARGELSKAEYETMKEDILAS